MGERFISPERPPEGLDRELLTIVMEECAEVIQQAPTLQQRAGKALRFGLSEVQTGQILTNAERLGEEVGDLLAVMSRLCERGVIDIDVVERATAGKHQKLDVFLQAREER